MTKQDRDATVCFNSSELIGEPLELTGWVFSLIDEIPVVGITRGCVVGNDL